MDPDPDPEAQKHVDPDPDSDPDPQPWMGELDLNPDNFGQTVRDGAGPGDGGGADPSGGVRLDPTHGQARPSHRPSFLILITFCSDCVGRCWTRRWRGSGPAWWSPSGPYSRRSASRSPYSITTPSFVSIWRTTTGSIYRP